MPSQEKSSSSPQLVPPMESQSVITGKTLVQMLFYTFLMVTLPISSYFLSKKMFFQDMLGYNSDDSVVPSALTAVVMVHVVLGLFIYAAYTEDIPAKPKRD